MHNNYVEVLMNSEIALASLHVFVLFLFHKLHVDFLFHELQLIEHCLGWEDLIAVELVFEVNHPLVAVNHEFLAVSHASHHVSSEVLKGCWGI